MKRGVSWATAASVAALLIVILGSLTFVPQWLYPPLTEAELAGVVNAEVRIQLQQAQAQMQNSVRSTLLQAIAGMLVIVGAAATWRQVQVSRDGQITDRFIRAVDQIGSENVDVRVGGVYALERVARNSSDDRAIIQYILGSFIHNHASWPAGRVPGVQHPTPTVDDSLPWLQVRAPDVQAAIAYLGRRGASPGAGRLVLSRVDLRGLALSGARLPNTRLRHANLARAWMPGTRLDGSDMKAIDLRKANLAHASFVDVNLSLACLQGANLRNADLTGADLRGANLEGANLDEAILTGATSNTATTWPDGFDVNRLRHTGARSLRESGPQDADS